MQVVKIEYSAIGHVATMEGFDSIITLACSEKMALNQMMPLEKPFKLMVKEPEGFERTMKGFIERVNSTVFDLTVEFRTRDRRALRRLIESLEKNRKRVPSMSFNPGHLIFDDPVDASKFHMLK